MIQVKKWFKAKIRATYQQLEAVITTIGEIFEQSTLTIPDKPWLPNLEEKIATPNIGKSNDRSLKVPIGLLDILQSKLKKSMNMIWRSPAIQQFLRVQDMGNRRFYKR